MTAWIGIVSLLSMQVAIDVERKSSEIHPSVSDQVASSLAVAIRQRTRLSVRIVQDCEHDRTCGGPKAAPEQVQVQLFAGATRLRLVAERKPSLRGGPWRAQADVPLHPAPDDPKIWSLAVALFPAETFGAHDLATATHVDNPKSGGSPAVPWAIASAGFAAAGLGIGFAVSSANAVDNPRDPAELLAMQDKRQTHGVVAIVSLSVAVAALVTATVVALAN